MSPFELMDQMEREFFGKGSGNFGMGGNPFQAFQERENFMRDTRPEFGHPFQESQGRDNFVSPNRPGFGRDGFSRDENFSDPMDRMLEQFQREFFGGGGNRNFTVSSQSNFDGFP